MRKRVFLVSACAALPMFLSACQPVYAPLMGQLYMDVKGPVTATEASSAARQGRACAQTILGLIATGDASIEAAARAGGIKQVVAVDHESKNLLGIVATFCTVVRGN